LFALVLIILAAGIIVPFSIGYILAISQNVPAPASDFKMITSTNQSSVPTNQNGTSNTLIVGNAFNEQKKEAVNVSISIIGLADGYLEDSVNINIMGGTVNVNGYEPFSVLDGSGTLVKSGVSGVTTIELEIGEHYGGKQTSWLLMCEVKEVNGATFSIKLSAESVNLPLDDNPSLTHLSINCDISFE